MAIEKRPLGRDEIARVQTVDLRFGNEELPPALDDGDLPALDELVERVAAHAESGPGLGDGEEVGHIAPASARCSSIIRRKYSLGRISFSAARAESSANIDSLRRNAQTFLGRIALTFLVFIMGPLYTYCITCQEAAWIIFILGLIGDNGTLIAVSVEKSSQ